MSLFHQIKKNVKGAFGEIRVDLTLGRFTKDSCFTVRDLLLVRDGKSTQIDNILFTTKKVYVIESKNYSGWIYGSETGNSWTQTFNHYGKVTKSSFYNPLAQNYGHIKYLSTFLDIPITNFINIVVFSNDSSLKNITTEKPYNHVINKRELVKLIETIEMQSKDCFRWEDLEKFKNVISFINKSGIVENFKHKNYVKSVVKKKNTK
jgi:hypothetical protein